MSEFVAWINETEHRLSAIEPEMTLLHFIRSVGLTGSKLGCGEGGCGACTVAVGTFDLSVGRPTYIAVNACLMPLAVVHNRHVITVEGIGTVSKPHLVQQAMATDASQCGFCTPGFVMSLWVAWRNGALKEDRVAEILDGNLCRCTGYRPIIDAGKQVCAMGKRCCKVQRDSPDKQEREGQGSKDRRPSQEVDDQLPSQQIPNPRPSQKSPGRHHSQEIIFPPKLKVHLEEDPPRLTIFGGSRVTWYCPVTIPELLELKATHPQAKIVFGNTEVGIEMKSKQQNYPILIYGGEIRELSYIQEEAEGVEFGANVRLAELNDYCLLRCQGDGGKFGILAAVAEMLRWFAGNQIRNVSSWAGNVATASPISDLNPIWAASGAHLTLLNNDGRVRKVRVDEFFLGYRKTDLSPDEIIKSIFVPFLGSREYFWAQKQSKRRDDDITIVNAAFRIKLDESDRVVDCSLAYGGMGPTTLTSKLASKKLMGSVITDDGFLENFIPLLRDEFKLPLDAVGGMTEYRNALCTSLFFKFYLFLCDKLGVILADSLRSAFAKRDSQIPYQSSQYYPPNGEEDGLTGEPIAHLAALKHSTGNAQYLDDIPKQPKELYAGLVLSTRAHAEILGIDATEALKLPNLVRVITFKDLPEGGRNTIGAVFDDEHIFAEQIVTSIGQIIALVLAEDQLIARRAAKLCKVQYQDLPAILTINEAIEQGSFHPPVRHLSKGDVEGALVESDVTLQGTSFIGGQEHFYLETQAALVIPRPEDDAIEVVSSTQNPTEGQHFVAHVLNIPAHKVICRVKRLGGGFGGKETRSSFLIAALAVAARKTDRPVRCMMDRDEDMIFSGQRHPFQAKYRLGVTREGKLLAADVELYANGGHSLDLSLGVLDRALTHVDNCYNFPAMRVCGRICKTNLPSNTAFRGFGAPQGMFFTEVMMSHIAQALSMEVEAVRKMNLYKDGDVTHCKMPLEDPSLGRMWQELEVKASLAQRTGQIATFNEQNRWKKRGISMLPTKFGIAFGVRFMNQAGALVHVLRDGSILLAHGGVEMGQGLHTKMCQIAAKVFNVPLDTVFFDETSTTTVANTSPSAASASSDLNGMAVLDACNQINDRLEPFRSSHPTAPFATIASMAYLERVDLSARGFYATPGLDFDWERNEGRFFNYFTYGAACSEVELDVLTGDHQVLRTDVIVDLGKSLNPTVDIGQIEGAFVQGMGLFTIEQPLYLRNGMLLNRGPGGYKIPTAGDIPRVFNVSLLGGVRNERAIAGSKAVGEPPLFLSASVLFALQEAVRAARKSAKWEAERLGRPFNNQLVLLDSPATAERLRLACGDMFVSEDGKMVDPRENQQAWCFEV